MNLEATCGGGMGRVTGRGERNGNTMNIVLMLKFSKRFKLTIKIEKFYLQIQVWWLTPVVPACWKWRQEGHHKLEGSLNFIVSSRTVWTTERLCLQTFSRKNFISMEEIDL